METTKPQIMEKKLFKYRCRDKVGLGNTGTIEAPSIKEAETQLWKKFSYVDSIEEIMEKKLSLNYWGQNIVNCEDQSGNKILYFDGNRETYDKILSLEAKIEELERLLNLKETKIEPRYALEIRLGVCRKDLQQIAKLVEVVLSFT